MYRGTLKLFEGHKANYDVTFTWPPKEEEPFTFKFIDGHSYKGMTVYGCLPRGICRTGNVLTWHVHGRNFKLHIEEDDTLSIWT